MGMEQDANAKGQHLLLIRGMDWDKNLSAEQLQDVMGRFMDWVKSIETEGVLVGAQPLAPGGAVLSGPNGHTVADGPFAELKEAVGGYFLLQVDSLEHAKEIASRCPALEHGAIMEVRPVLQQCPMMERIEQEKLATAG